MNKQDEETTNENYFINWDGLEFEVQFEDFDGNFDHDEIDWEYAPLNLIAHIHFTSICKYEKMPLCKHETIESLMSDLKDEETRNDLIDDIEGLDTVQTASYGTDGVCKLVFRLELEEDQMKKLLAIEAVKQEFFNNRVKVINYVSNTNLIKQFEL